MPFKCHIIDKRLFKIVHINNYSNVYRISKSGRVHISVCKCVCIGKIFECARVLVVGLYKTINKLNNHWVAVTQRAPSVNDIKKYPPTYVRRIHLQYLIGTY